MTTKKVKSALRRNLINGKVHAIPPYGYKKDENNIKNIPKRKYKMREKLILKFFFEMKKSS